MSLDITLLSVLKRRKEFERLHRVVNERALDSRTRAVLRYFARYFEETDCEVIPMTGEFSSWFVATAKSLSEDDAAVYRRLFKRIEEDPSPQARSLLVNSLLEADLSVKIADALTAYDAEEEIDLPAVLRALVDQHEEDVERKVNLPEVAADDTLFDEDAHSIGFRWRWSCLNETMRELRPGDFGILAGRPDKGKTTAIADNITAMVPQIDSVYGEGSGRAVLWFNNEGPGSRILKRCVQSALGLPTSALVKLQESGKLWDMYEEALGGHRTLLRVFNIHGMRNWQVEEIIRQSPPALIIFDMIDNIRFDGSVLNGGQRTDQILEGMYQWARELAVKYRCPIIATSQISADGDGLAFPTLPMLKDSKTGKQGTADFIITVGARNEPGLENLRFVGLTKNKLSREGTPSSPKAELILDGACGRFVEASHD